MWSPLQQFGARVRAELSQTFRSLRHPNFRTYNIGQLISLTGTWMQTVALQWITYDMTHSAWLLGLVGVFTNIPVLLLSLVGGSVADRYDRRRVLIITQWVELVLAVIMTMLVATGALQVWMILALSAALGVATAFEMPCRQALVPHLIEGNDMVNAVSLNSVIFNTTRMIGPALGAILLSSFGNVVCFAFNAASFLGAIVTLHMLRLAPRAPEPANAPPRESGWSAIVTGVRVALTKPDVRNVFILTFFTSFFGFQFSVLLPVFVKDVFHGSAESLGLLSAAAAFGSLGASLFLASRGKPEALKRTMQWAAFGVCFTLLAFAASRSLPLTLAIEVIIGITYSMQLNSSNSFLQLSVSDDVRGRVMSVYTMILLGAAPFGSLVMGRVADSFGAPLAMALCGVACGLSALFYVTRK